MFSTKRRREILILLFLAVAALVPRLFRLADVPPGLDGDEVFNAIDALRLGNGNWQVYFEGNNGREALFLYLVALSLNLFGQSVWAIRLPAVLLGTGSVLLAYLIGRDEFNRRVGFIGAALMAVSLWPMMHSRWGLRAVSLTFLTALTIYFYGRALQRNGKALGLWLAAGLALGLTMYTYIPSRLFPLVILVWFGWMAFTQRQRFRDTWRHLLLSLLIALLVFAPFGLYMLQNPGKVNQRVESLTTSLEKAEAGDPGAILRSVSNVLLMFTFSGDTAGRYHVAARPVFDPLTGIFFYLGLAVSLWLAFRFRGEPDKRSTYALLLLWTGAMLAPNSILGVGTSFLRAAGAIVPIYLITGIGVDHAYTWLRSRWPDRARLWRVSLVVLVAGGLLLTVVDSWVAYFNVWSRDPVTRNVYHADLARIGRYLKENPPPADANVFVAFDYVTDATPIAFDYYSDQAVTWFNYKSSLGWRPGAPESWYFVSADKPLLPVAATWLTSLAEAESVTFEGGGEAFTLFRIDGASMEWVPTIVADLEFIDGPQLIGFDMPEEVYRGDTIPLVLHWQVPANQQPMPNRLTYVQAQLEDESGNVWGLAEGLLGYPQASWQAGDRFVQFLNLDIPQGLPPGPAYLRFGLRDWEGPLYGVVAGSQERTGPFLVRSRPVTDIALGPDLTVFDDTLALEGSTFSSLIVPGLPMNISLDWLTLKPPPEDYRVQLELASPDASEPFFVQTYELWPGIYPPSQWQAGEQVTTLHRLQVPVDMPTAADPLLKVQLLSEKDASPLPLTQGNDELAELTLELREHNYDMPEIGHLQEADFGENIRLLGYDLDAGNNHLGGELQLTLYWLALDTPEKGYTVFNHILGPNGQIEGQFDSPPVGDAWLTSTWLPDEIIVDQRQIPIGPDASAGPHRLAIGLYTVGDGERLPVYLDGQRQPNDQLILAEVLIEP